MSKHEQLSQLMDETVAQPDWQLLAQTDTQTARAHYHLIRHALRQPGQPHLDVSQHVMAALAAEPTYAKPTADPAPQAKVLSLGWRLGGQCAIAASVAAVMVLGAQQLVMAPQTSLAPSELLTLPLNGMGSPVNDQLQPTLTQPADVKTKSPPSTTKALTEPLPQTQP